MSWFGQSLSELAGDEGADGSAGVEAIPVFLKYLSSHRAKSVVLLALSIRFADAGSSDVADVWRAAFSRLAEVEEGIVARNRNRLSNRHVPTVWAGSQARKYFVEGVVRAKTEV